MRIRLTIRDDGGEDRDVEITAEDGTLLSEIVHQLDDVIGDAGASGRGLWSGSRRLVPESALGGPGLRTGDIVSIGPASPPDVGANALPRLRVAGGPDAGQYLALPRGTTTIGRDRSSDLRIQDPRVSRDHARLVVSATGVTIHDLDSTNGTTIDGVPVTRRGTPLHDDTFVRLGDSVLGVQTEHDPVAGQRFEADGSVRVSRTARPALAAAPGEVVMPDAPPRRVRLSWQWLGAAVLPAIAGAGLALATHNREFLIFALLGPLGFLATSAITGATSVRARRRIRRGGRVARREAEDALQSALAAQTRARRRAHPDPAAIVAIADTPTARIWERRRGDPDWLEVRVGLTDARANLIVHGDPVPESRIRLRDVPATVRLCDGPLGLGGPSSITAGLARAMIAQLVTQHAPNDLTLAIALSDDRARDWRWLRWLPHLDGPIARSPSEQQTLVDRLVAHVDSRRLPSPGRSEAGWPGRWTVLVLNRYHPLAEIAGLTRLLADGPLAGVTTICIDDDPSRLPAECVSIVTVAGELGSRLHIDRRGGGDDVSVAGAGAAIADLLSVERAERVARALAPFTDAGEHADPFLPASCRLFDLPGRADVTPDEILAGWRRGGRPLVPLGVGPDGPVVLDLARDGPHALVAGTTGAGKSELLQTLVAGLATTNSPADLAFVLVDYKGGATFAVCAQLPHTAAIITDLDPQLTERALRSLNAELRRREALLAAVGAADLTGYRAGPAHEGVPLGRLVLVVDEFAALAEEFPDLLRGLVAIAQRGRSLGVHLVLATQRPAGIVSPEIAANLALRICLRVTDAADSIAVVATDWAVSIDPAAPGRAVVRTGATTTQLQTARVSGEYRAPNRSARVLALDQWGRTVAGAPPVGPAVSDLDVLVAAMKRAAQSARLAAPRRPWCPPLPDRLGLSELEPGGRASAIPIGRCDEPDEQQQPALEVDLDYGGSLLFAGAPRSGRSTALLTLARSAAGRLGRDDLHIQVIDCAAGGLLSLAELANTATMIGLDHPAGIGRLLERISDEVTRRADVVARPADRAAGPYLLLLLDGWEAFVAASDEYDGGQAVDALCALLRAPPIARLTVAIAGGRASLTPRLTGTVSTTFALRLADPADFAVIGISARDVPRVLPPGRALRAGDGMQVQFAVGPADPQPSEGASGRVPPLPPPAGAIVVRPLPGRVRLEDVLPACQPRSGEVALGVGGDSAEPVTVDLFAGAARWIVAGPPRSGRSQVLVTIARQARWSDCDVVVAAALRSPLTAAATALGITVLGPADALRPTERPRRLILVDDSAVLLDHDLDDALCALCAMNAQATPPGSMPLAVVVSAISDELALTYRGIAATVRRARSGILLRPAPGDGDLLGVRLPRVRTSGPPGRGVLVTEQPHLQPRQSPDGSMPIQVALGSLLSPCAGTGDQSAERRSP